jgi:hypothetical protein
LQTGGICLTAQEALVPPRSFRFQEGIKVRSGYDLLNGALLVSPVVQGRPQAQGQLVTSSFLRIDRLKTLHETIGVGVGVDGDASHFGFSADVKPQSLRQFRPVERCTLDVDLSDFVTKLKPAIRRNRDVKTIFG